MDYNWMKTPQLVGENLEIFYPKVKCNWDFSIIVNMFEKYQKEFFETFCVQSSFAKPLKYYLLPHSEWKDFKIKFKEKSKMCSNWFDKNFDYNWIVTDLLERLISCSDIKNAPIVEGVVNYYYNKLAYQDEFEKAFEHIYIKQVANLTFFNAESENVNTKKMVVVKYLLDNPTGVDWKTISGKDIEPLFLKAKVFYDKKYDVKTIPDKVADIKNAADVLRFLDKNMAIGYLSKDGNVFINRYEGIHTNYKLQTPKQALTTHVGTCAEYAGLLKYILHKQGIESKIFYFANYDELRRENNYEDLSSHFVVFFNHKGKWINLEAANQTCLGIKKFKNLSDGLTFKAKQMYYRKNLDVFEVENLPFGCDYVELHDACSKEKKINFTGNDARDLRIEYPNERFKSVSV